MATEEDFVLSIGETIKVETPTNAPDVLVDPPLNLTPLKRQTIEILIDILRENRSSGLAEFQVLGQWMYSVLFQQPDGEENAVGRALQTALDDYRPDLLRIELRFEGKVEPGIDTWPWEYLYRPGRGFLVVDPSVILTRRLKLVSAPRSFQVTESPVRILFIAVEPTAPPPGPLDTGAPEELGAVQWEPVWEVLEDVARGSGGEIEVMGYVAEGGDERPPMGGFSQRTDNGAPLELRLRPGEPTLGRSNFGRLIAHWEPHVVHFVGHGRCGEDGLGRVALVDARGGPDWYDQSELAAAMLSARPLRLVFLQACETARGVRSDPYLAISGVAAKLAAENIPAVVGMNYRVQNEVANAFARAFYTALCEHAFLDQAVQQGRQAVQGEFRDWAEKRGFALPVLYTRMRQPLLPTREAAGIGVGGPSTLMSSMPTSSIPCQFCGKLTLLQKSFCGSCGKSLLCGNCGQRVTDQFCDECGTRFVVSPPDEFAEPAGEAGPVRA